MGLGRASRATPRAGGRSKINPARLAEMEARREHEQRQSEEVATQHGPAAAVAGSVDARRLTPEQLAHHQQLLMANPIFRIALQTMQVEALQALGKPAYDENGMRLAWAKWQAATRLVDMASKPLDIGRPQAEKTS